jgi:hypothetical protein
MRSRLVAFVLLLAIPVAMVFHRYRSEHQVFTTLDARTGLEFASVCEYAAYSFRTYVVVAVPNDRRLLKAEIPFSADTLSDCKDSDYYRPANLVPDSELNSVTIRFRNRETIKLPISLRDLDLPERARAILSASRSRPATQNP